MSSINVYSLDGFSLYLMPKGAAPECPPCQSETLPSVFEDDDDCELKNNVSVLSKVNKVIKKVLVRSKLPSRNISAKFFSSTRLRSLTLSRQSSGSATNSFTSKNSS
ncbi:hypothetical protein PCANC_15230 [Puccinia coronata f. sp. avenae]|uniref:Uncharacterized protein n=1 Tax=Puccinia coronata f. sp. avenae TaxID=200324 RepID=A0A2N5VNK2_9BASI|nr:hypothetical protein PCANC_15230 [Puccinia coronata f. sp. avenae]